jgi:exodeoxyribonuclease V alpha subunit
MVGVERSIAADMAEDVTPRGLIRQLVERGALLRLEEKLASQIPDESVALFSALLGFARQGHLCLAIEEERVVPSLDSLVSDCTLSKNWEALILQTPRMSNSSLIYSEGRFYLPKYWVLEERIVGAVSSMVDRNVKPISLPPLSSTLTEEQKRAVALACNHPISLITGGPGTGKTSVALEVARAFALAGRPFISLAAPTGKAASHLASKLEGLSPHLTFGTLHALLGIRAPKDLYTNENPPLPTDLLIVDEGSMIDTALFARLLTSIGPHTHLVILGDANQLPAVEGGSIFADLLKSGIPSETLTQVFRSDRQEILSIAEAILAGETLPTNLDLGLAGGNTRSVYENLWKHVHNFFPRPQKKRPNPEELLAAGSQFCLLSTLRRGLFGGDRINAFLKERFTALANPDDYLPIPIMISQNDKQTELTNGETGILIQQLGGEATGYFSGGRTFPLHELPPYNFAYCLSVHKSQGSEYDRVLLLIPEGSETFGREVLYTGVTRAKEQLEIDGHPEAISRALKHTSLRLSGITCKIRHSLLGN